MFLIVGLGNPGLAYSYTRHNVGFMFVDSLSYCLGFPDFKNKFHSLYSEKILGDEAKVLLQKPQTFMNLSGKAVAEIVSFFKIPMENVFVVHDDIDIAPLDLKIKRGGGHGGHNGLRDIDKVLGKNYWRIRIGVGRPIEKYQVSEYVLSPFHKDELTKDLPKIFDAISKFTPELLFSEDKTFAINSIKSELAAK